MKVAIRTDASPAIGSGHVMRCLALADALAARGAAVRFVARALPAHLADVVGARGHALVALADGAASEALDAEQTLALVAPCDWIVVDHYGLGSAWERAARAAARVLAVDDIARPHRADIVLDQNLHGDAEARYAESAAGGTLLLGPRYALLAPEFAQARERCRPRDGAVRRLHVFLGGMDSANATEPVLQAIALVDAPQLHVDVVIGATHPARARIEAACASLADARCHVQTGSMAALLADADLAIGAGGSATWERCALGVPTFALCVADNQRDVLFHAARRGLVYAPEIAAGDVAAVALHLRALLANGGLRHHLSQTGMDLVDGRGAPRVAAALTGAAPTLRRATFGDARRLHEWRNEPKVRAASRNPAPIAWVEHETWLRDVLASPARHLLIGERGGAAIGVLRFDVDGSAAEISIYLVPAAMGRGEGAALLGAGEEWLRREIPGVDRLRAHVGNGNLPSQQLFEGAGYAVSSSEFTKKLR